MNFVPTCRRDPPASAPNAPCRPQSTGCRSYRWLSIWCSGCPSGLAGLVRVLAAAAALVSVSARATTGAAPDNAFEPGGAKPKLAVVTLPGVDATEIRARQPEMMLRLQGVLAVLDRRELADLRAAGAGKDDDGNAAAGVAFADVRLDFDGGNASTVVHVLRRSDGAWIAVDDRDRRTELRAGAWMRLAAGWNTYAGPLDGPRPGDVTKVTFDVRGPLVHGLPTFDQETLGERLLAGGSTAVNGIDRLLLTAQARARLPQGYDPRHPAGLLVWNDPAGEGVIPRELEPALDALGIICIAPVGAGNGAATANRHQLMFDALATAISRYHVDMERMYVGGLSGGGRIASTELICFPEVFRGGVSIVGIACYQAIPNGTGQFWPGGFRKPESKRFALARMRPLVVATGGNDFNFREIKAAVGIMKADGLPITLMEKPEFGHAMPDEKWARQIMDALDGRSAAGDEARRTAARQIQAHALKAASESARHDALMRLIAQCPWTDEAWAAAADLKLKVRPAVAVPGAHGQDGPGGP